MGRSTEKIVVKRDTFASQCYSGIFSFLKSSFSSVCVNTIELECRPETKLYSHSKRFIRKKRSDKTINSINLRDSLRFWHQFTETQKATLKLHLESTICLDFTAYSAGPSEQLLIQNPKEYFWLLERNHRTKQGSLKLMKMLQTRNIVVIDGFGKQILIRKNLSQFLDRLRNSWFIFSCQWFVLIPSWISSIVIACGTAWGKPDCGQSVQRKKCFEPYSGINHWTSRILPDSTRKFDKNVVECFEMFIEYLKTVHYCKCNHHALCFHRFKVPPRRKHATFFSKTDWLNIAKRLVASGKVENCPTPLKS